MVKEVKQKKVATKKPRTDKRKNVWKVVEVLVKNPNATVREIAKKTGIWSSTVQRAKEEVAQSGTKDSGIVFIVDAAKTRLQRISAIKDRYIDQLDLTDDLWTKEVDLANKLWQEDMKLVTVLWGDITKPDWWLKEVIDDERLKAIESLSKMFTK